jgi:GNAT superfamily N-acetyltransferase
LTANEIAGAPLSSVEPLTLQHSLAGFDCGAQPALNEWLKHFAWTNQRNETSRTYVVHRGGRVVAYYSIAAGSARKAARKEGLPARVSKGLANHPVPLILLTRLAVDKSEQGTGLGKALLKDALRRIADAADIVAARAVLVHAIDEAAAAFYRHFGFEPSPTGDLHLMLLMKDLRANLGRS